MNETEPKYFTEFRNHIDRRFDTVETNIIKQTEKIVESLAISTANEFREIYKRFNEIDNRFDGIDNRFKGIDKRFDVIEYEIIGIKQEIKGLATKEDFNEIKSLIGSYEIRSRKIEEILLDDHKPRIKELEKVVFKLV